MKVLQYMFFCHRIPERSFFFRGKQFPICARCTGILCGYIIGLIMAFSHIHLSFFYVLLFLPIALDGGGQLHGHWESTNIRRFITGSLAGIGVIYIFQTSITIVFPWGQQAGLLLYQYLNQ